MCFGYSKEQFHGEGSFEYAQHMLQTYILGTSKNGLIERDLLSAYNVCYE